MVHFSNLVDSAFFACLEALNEFSELIPISSNPLEFPNFVPLLSFELQKSYVTTVPALLYTLVAGSLSDTYGRKPLILLPLVGNLLEAALTLVGYYFMDRLPLWYWYCTETYDLLGGEGEGEEGV